MKIFFSFCLIFFLQVFTQENLVQNQYLYKGNKINIDGSPEIKSKVHIGEEKLPKSFQERMLKKGSTMIINGDDKNFTQDSLDNQFQQDLQNQTNFSKIFQNMNEQNIQEMQQKTNNIITPMNQEKNNFKQIVDHNIYNGTNIEVMPNMIYDQKPKNNQARKLGVGNINFAYNGDTPEQYLMAPQEMFRVRKTSQPGKKNLTNNIRLSSAEEVAQFYNDGSENNVKGREKLDDFQTSMNLISDILNQIQESKNEILKLNQIKENILENFQSKIQDLKDLKVIGKDFSLIQFFKILFILILFFF